MLYNQSGFAPAACLMAGSDSSFGWEKVLGALAPEHPARGIAGQV